MNKTSRERLSRDFVTRTAWLYEYRVRLRNRETNKVETQPVHRGSYVRLTVNDLIRLEAVEHMETPWIFEVIYDREIYETPVIIGRPKAEFLKSPVLDMGERLKLNMES